MEGTVTDDRWKLLLEVEVVATDKEPIDLQCDESWDEKRQEEQKRVDGPNVQY